MSTRPQSPLDSRERKPHFLDALVGHVGAKGDKGEKGDKGNEGNRGPKGDQGDKGERGWKGEKGDKGDMGESGLTGKRGLIGYQGGKGERGDKGEKGEKGERGFQGPKGDSVRGERGPQGKEGKQGIQGISGPQGLPSPLQIKLLSNRVPKFNTPLTFGHFPVAFILNVTCNPPSDILVAICETATGNWHGICEFSASGKATSGLLLLPPNFFVKFLGSPSSSQLVLWSL